MVMSREVNLPQLRGVVFDLDGTLTVPNLDFKLMYERCGVDLDDDLLAAVILMPSQQREAATSVIEEMEAEGRRTLKLAPGVVEMAKWLQAHEIPVALVTRNTRDTVGALIENLWQPAGLSTFSPAISRDSNPDLPAKPDPASLVAIAEAWGMDLPSGELLMVGDSPSNDVAFGKAAGVATALVDSGRRFTEGGSDGGADVRVACLAELPREIWHRFHVGGPLGTNCPLVKYAAPVPASAASAAALEGDVATLKALNPAELCAPDPDHPGGFQGNTPLIWAAEGGCTESVALILATVAREGHSGLDSRGFLGATAVSRASRRGHVACLKALLAAGADPDVANSKLQFPLHFAAFKEHPAAVAVLLEGGANPLVLDRKGRTPAQDTKSNAIAAVLRDAEVRRTECAVATPLDVK